MIPDDAAVRAWAALHGAHAHIERAQSGTFCMNCARRSEASAYESRMTYSRMLLLLVPQLVACAPTDPQRGTTDGDSGSTVTSAASADSSSTTSATTTSATTSESTGESTGGLPDCSWYWPEYSELIFCPPLPDMNADVVGTTPYGELSLRHAHFGLLLCAECPTADGGSLRLYADPPVLGEATGDFLSFEWVSEGTLHLAEWDTLSRLGGHGVEIVPDKLTLTGVVIPSLAQTSPPLDEAAPPVLSGTLTISGNGWDLAGSFSAPLCTTVDWSLPCE